MIIPVILPARNEEKNLGKSLPSLFATASDANVEIKPIVVSDGSSDDTVNVAKSMGAYVIDLPDRGYSALGRPELADAHNAGYDFAHRTYPECEFLMVLGADTILEVTYLKELLKAMERDPKLAICAGVLEGRESVAPGAVTGTGRIIRGVFWREFGARYPEGHFAWESYPLTYAKYSNWHVATVHNAVFRVLNVPLARVDWANYGIGMREAGSLFLFVFARAARRVTSGDKNGIRQGLSLIRGYVTGGGKPYPKNLRRFTRYSQLIRVRQKILRF